MEHRPSATFLYGPPLWVAFSSLSFRLFSIDIVAVANFLLPFFSLGSGAGPTEICIYFWEVVYIRMASILWSVQHWRSDKVLAPDAMTFKFIETHTPPTSQGVDLWWIAYLKACKRI